MFVTKLPMIARAMVHWTYGLRYARRRMGLSRYTDSGHTSCRQPTAVPGHEAFGADHEQSAFLLS